MDYSITLLPRFIVERYIRQKKADIFLMHVEDNTSYENIIMEDLTLHPVFYVNSRTKIDNFTDIKDQTVAVTGSVTGFSSLLSQLRQITGRRPILDENPGRAMRLLKRGDFHLLLIDRAAARRIVKNMKYSGIEEAPLSFGYFKSGFSFKKSSSPALNILKSDIKRSGGGKYTEKLYDRWFANTGCGFFCGNNLYIIAGFFGLCLFVILFILNSVVLNRRIEDRTEKLNRSLFELRSTQVKLNESQKRFKRIFDKSPLGILLLNYEGKIILYNESITKLFGIQNPQKLYEFSIFKSPDLPDDIFEQISIKNIFEREIVYDFDSIRSSGRYETIRTGTAAMEVSVIPIAMSSEDSGIGYLCQLKDVTENRNLIEEIKKSSEQFRLTFEAIKYGLWDWNIQSNMVNYNRRIFTMLGYSAEIFPGDPGTWLELIHPDDRESAVKKIIDRIKHDKSFTLEYRMRKKDGSWLWIEGRGQTIEWDEQGSPKRVIGTHSDISRRKEAEISLLKDKQKVVESEKIRSMFMENVSHEIRTPLNGIIGFARILAREKLDNDSRIRYLNMIDENSEHIMSLLAVLSDTALIERGEFEIFRQNFSCGDLMHEIFELYLHKIKKIPHRNIKLICRNLTEEDDFFIYSDRIRIKQVICSLIDCVVRNSDNASVEFGCNVTEMGAVFFVMSSECFPASENTECYRDSSGKSENSAGSIGLWIPGDLVRLLGGDMEIVSTSQGGTVFNISIAGISDVSDYDILESKRSTIEGGRILVIDDNYLIYFHISEFLKTRNVICDYAQSGYEALDLIREQDNIDLILLDIQMPGMGGLEVIREIRRHNSKIPVIAQTGHLRREQIEEYYDAGFNDVIGKPIDENELLEKLIGLMAFGH